MLSSTPRKRRRFRASRLAMTAQRPHVGAAERRLALCLGLAPSMMLLKKEEPEAFKITVQRLKDAATRYGKTLARLVWSVIKKMGTDASTPEIEGPWALRAIVAAHARALCVVLQAPPVQLRGDLECVRGPHARLGAARPRIGHGRGGAQAGDGPVAGARAEADRSRLDKDTAA